MMFDCEQCTYKEYIAADSVSRNNLQVFRETCTVPGASVAHLRPLWQLPVVQMPDWLAISNLEIAAARLSESNVLSTQEA